IAAAVAQLLLNLIERALHLLQALVEHAVAHLLLLPGDNVAIEALFQLGDALGVVVDADRHHRPVRHPAADQNRKHNDHVEIGGYPVGKALPDSGFDSSFVHGRISKRSKAHTDYTDVTDRTDNSYGVSVRSVPSVSSM